MANDGATDLADCTAHELLQLYRSGLASPTEALEAVLTRIARDNPRINAFRLVDEESARQSARASELRWSQGAPLGLLDGIPVSIKDLILTRGWSTLRGSQTVDPDQPWDIDAPATLRLRQHHAVLLGKTTTPEFGCKGVTDSYLTGITRNPWNLSRSSGGSSGGSAAAVSAGMGPLSIGTDGAGSIRIPSAFSGVVGIKASFGRVPAWPPSPFASLAHVGPHARSVEDAALLLTVLAEPDARDWSALPFEARDYRVGLERGVAGLRIAYSPTLGYAQVDPEIIAALDLCARHLEDLGAHVSLVDPGFPDPLELICAMWFLGAATLVAAQSESARARMDPALLWEAEQGHKLSALDISRVHMRRAELGTAMRLFHQNYDLLLTPAVAVTALPATPTGPDVMARAEDFLGWTPFSYPFNLTQQPAIAIPCGLSKAGLPMSAQIVGPMHQDALVLAAARALESALDPLGRPTLAQG
jgi:aspartyl-tRNA(Asn)/glutamyl-tRNA(Gln) amidotransferase subunit A